MLRWCIIAANHIFRNRFVGSILVPSRIPVNYFHSNQKQKQKISQDVRNSFMLLNLKEDCTYEELRDAYLSLSKKYHPDSGSNIKDAKKFSQIKDAYYIIKKHMMDSGKEVSKEDIDDINFDIKHTAPQHRQYLTFEGVGYGTPSQRQKQYQQFKINRASDNVYEYRTQKIASKHESSLVSKDKQATRRNVVRQGLDRLVEDLIQESMARGDFDDLPGKGKKIEYKEHNPMVDTFTHNLNRIMINNGYAPEWVMLDKEIRDGIKQARQKFLEGRGQLGKEPFTTIKKKHWDRLNIEFSESLLKVNSKINKFNFIVPTLQQQMVPYSFEKEYNKVMTKYTELETEGFFEKKRIREQQYIEQVQEPEISTNKKTLDLLIDVWRQIRLLVSFNHKR